MPCRCGSRAWSRGLSECRPLAAESELLTASDAVWWGLGEEDWLEAFASHPRIGERHAPGVVTARSLAWSEREQSATALGDDTTARALEEGNRAYEAKFGRTFLVFASGKSAREILAILGRRLNADDASEMREAAQQQQQITGLRLRRWMGAI